jgi:signal transduction histidine kinase
MTSAAPKSDDDTPEVPAAPRPLFDARRQRLIFGLLAIACIVGAASGFIFHLRDLAIDAGKTEIRNLGAVLAEQTARTFQSAELVLAAIEERAARFNPENEGDRLALHHLLADKIAGVPQIKYATIIGPDGQLAVSSATYPAPGVWLGDRPYFTVHRDTPDLPLVIGEPVQSRTGGAWLIFVSRRRVAADGSFAGVMTVALDPDYFERVYKSATSSSGTAIGLLRTDGIVLSRVPRVEGVIGRRINSDALYRLTNALAGDFLHMVSLIDGDARIFAPQWVPGYPLVIYTSVREADIFANWRHKALLIGVTAAVAVLTILVLMVSSRTNDERARRQTALLQDAIESIGEGFVLYDAEDRVVLSNRKFREIRRQNPLSWQIGASYSDILRASVATGATALPAEGIEAWIDRRNRQRRNPLGVRLHERNGRWVRVTDRRTREGGLVAIHSDITELKQAQADAEAARSRMAYWAEAANDWFWETAPDFRLTFLSRGLENDVGDRMTAGRARWPFDIATDFDPDEPKWREHLQTLAAQRPFRDFVFAVRENGAQRYFSTSGKPVFDAHGQFVGYRGTSSDVTFRIETGRALQRQTAELAAMVDKLDAARMEAESARITADAANQAKSLFLAHMSHELRTPLNAILGFSQLIQHATVGPLDTRYREYARDVRDSGEYLLRLINDVLDTSKIEVGRQELHEERIDIADVAQECRRLLLDKAQDGKVMLILALASDLPPVFADRLRVKQVMLNLLSNAVKFTPGGGSVTLSAALADDGGVAIMIADTGIGMRAEDIPVALEQFRQLESPMNRHYEGTGLGLPLAKALVELHGGVLEIKSQPGKGTTVRVWLPPRRVIGMVPREAEA